MISRLLITLILLFSCGHKSSSKPLPSAYDKAKEKSFVYASQIDESIFVRCDKLAFLPYLTVAGFTQNLNDFEQNGKWSRDRYLNPSCYPIESKGSISFDGMIAVLHHAFTVKDIEMVNRLWEYGEANNWVLGEGEYSNQIILRPIVSKVRSKLNRSISEFTSSDIDNILSGFRGHLLASYLWLQGRMDGHLNALEFEALKLLYRSNKDDPMYQSLYSRFTNGDQTKTLDILLNSPNFPNDYLPEDTGLYGWGSAPSSIYYLMVLSIIEGR